MVKQKINSSQTNIVRSRQGGTTGSASWATVGTSNTDTSNAGSFIQTGVLGSSATSGADVTVTFPVAFSQIPLVFVTVSSASASNQYATVNTVTTTTFKFRQLGGSSVESVNWMAIGQ